MAEHPILPYQRLLAVAIVALWLLLVVPGLTSRQTPMFDEIFHARAGAELATGRRPTELSHPPLLKDVTAFALLASGTAFDPTTRAWRSNEREGYPLDAVWWWRFPSVLAGAAALVTLGLLARALLGPGPAPLVAMGLLALDGCFFVHARVAMTNVWEVWFVLLAAVGAWKAAGEESGHDGWLALSGAACGLAIASRWSALAYWVICGAWLAWRLRETPRRWLPLVAAFSVAPALVYAAAYAPLVAIEPLPGAADLLSPAAWQVAFADAQLKIFEFHAYLHERHVDQSAWWTWPFMGHPVWYAFAWDAALVQVVWAIGNAVIWWTSLPALLAAAAAGRRQPALAFVAILGLGPWIAWGLQPRSMTFMHYFLPAIPFACIALAATAQAWWRGRALASGPAPFEPLAARAICVAFGLLAVAWMGYYWPLLTYTPIAKADALQRVWFGAAWL